LPEQETEDEYTRAPGALSVLQIVGIVLGSGLLVVIGLKGFAYFLVARLHLVPSGQSAAQYYQLGVKYKGAGWTEQARDSLNRAIKLEPQGVDGKRATIFLHAYLPRYAVQQEAVQMNIIGFNQAAGGHNEQAIQTYERCIKQFPKFEWPYGNLAALHVSQGKLDEAKELLSKILEVNPQYVNGWIHLAEANIAGKDFKRATECLNSAAAIDPDNAAVKALKTKIEFENQTK
jgi:tetratricopeptide (TPR) repeat protein